MANKTDAIGVFDSGLGGISVLRILVELMPNEDFIYFGDSKNAPYGIRSKEDVRALTNQNVDRLLSMGCKAICIACNTATSAAVKGLRERFPTLPLVGMEPAIKPAAEINEHPKVLVMATPMTIREEKFQALLARFDGQADFTQLPCPGLMEFIESGVLEGTKLDGFLKQLLWDYLDIDFDAIVLGCSHYPFVGKQIQKAFGRDIPLFDGCLGTAKELLRRIKAADLHRPEELTHKGKVTILNSDESHIALAEKLLYAV